MEKVLITEEGKTQVLALAKEHGPNLRLVIGVDIGATNTRVAVSQFGSSKLHQIYKEKFQSTPLLVTALQQIENEMLQLLNNNTRVVASCVAGAGPIEEGRLLRVTNFSPDVRELHRDRLPKHLFPRGGRTLLINDLEATCYGISSINASGTLRKYFERIWSPRNNNNTSDHYEESKEKDGDSNDEPALTTSPSTAKCDLISGHYLVVAVGTGLGAAVLLQQRGCNELNWTAFPTESGHTQIILPHPNDPHYNLETSVTKFISKKVYGNENYVLEYEDIVSGRGLVSVYEAVNSKHETRSAEDIVKGALKNEEECITSVEIHYRYLMRLLKNLCITFQVKGVFLAGDNQVTNNDVFQFLLNRLQSEFLYVPKREWVDHVELYVQKKTFNINLHGAVQYAKLNSQSSNGKL